MTRSKAIRVSSISSSLTYLRPQDALPFRPRISSESRLCPCELQGFLRCECVTKRRSAHPVTRHRPRLLPFRPSRAFASQILIMTVKNSPLLPARGYASTVATLLWSTQFSTGIHPLRPPRQSVAEGCEGLHRFLWLKTKASTSKTTTDTEAVNSGKVCRKHPSDRRH